MSVQSFAAQTTQDAFRRVRDKLGSAAVILQVKQSPAGVEVIAARERPRAGLLKLLDGGPIESIEAVAEPELPRLSTVELTDDSLAGRARLRLVQEEATPKTLGTALSRIEFPSDMAARLTSVAGSGPEAWGRILGWLERVFPTVAPAAPARHQPLVVGFLGDRGTGRSTLVRGLAARAAIEKPGQILWIQAGFPARPVASLGSVAPEGVQHRTVNHPEDFRRIARECPDVTAILVDFPGVDVHSAGERSALRRYLKACREVWPYVRHHGVVPATWSVREAVRSVREQAGLGAVSVAWTCLDRVADPGTMLATTLRTCVAPSFLHGDWSGDGSTSRAANWEELIDWLREESQQESTANSSVELQ